MNFAVITCMLLSSLVIVSAQQRFQRRGDHYLAKVAIHRPNPYSYSVDMNEQSMHQPRQVPGEYRPAAAYRRHPWRQGDRITKEEVVQNLAKALLARKKSSEEELQEKRKSNQEKLHEYALAQARLAQHPPKPHSRHPPPVPVSAPSSNPEPYQQVPIQTSMEHKGNDYNRMNNAPKEKQHSSAKIQETRYTKTLTRDYPREPPRVRTRQYMKSNSLRK